MGPSTGQYLKMLEEAQSVIEKGAATMAYLQTQKESLQSKNSELLMKVASLQRELEFYQLAEEMVESGQLDASLRKAKVEEMLKSGHDSKVYREAVSLAAQFKPLGQLDGGEGFQEKTAENPLVEAILGFVKNKNSK